MAFSTSNTDGGAFYKFRPFSKNFSWLPQILQTNRMLIIASHLKLILWEKSFFMSTALISLRMTFLRNFAFRERTTPWFIGWVFETGFGGRKTSSTAFRPSIIGCAGQLSTIRITLWCFFSNFLSSSFIHLSKKEAVHPTFHLWPITSRF